MTTTPRRRMRQNRVLALLDRIERDPRADAVIDAIGRVCVPCRSGAAVTRCTEGGWATPSIR
jgi:hypothetical protein